MGGDGPQDAEVTTPMTPDGIRKAAATERDAAVANARLAYKNALAEIDVAKQAAKEENDKTVKSVKKLTKQLNITASTIRRKASRDHAKSLEDAKNEYTQAIEEYKKSGKKSEEEYNSLVEAAEDEFVAKYEEARDNLKKIQSENQELLEKVRKEIEAEQDLAHEKREQAKKEYKLSLRNRRGVSPEDRNTILAKYEEEMGRYEKTMESLEERWQKTVDDLGIGKQYETMLENAVSALEEAKEQANSSQYVTRQENAQASIAARKAFEEKQASANAEKLKAEAEATEILEAAYKHRDEVIDRADEKYQEQQKLIQVEAGNAAISMNKVINEASKAYEAAVKKAKEMEAAERRTRSGKKM